MQFTIPAITLLSLLGSASALQNIFFGNSDFGCGSGSLRGGRTYFWFSDAPVCDTGAYGGQQYQGGGSVCNGQSYTLLGHSGLTFKGCNTRNGIYPTEVYDGGNKALNCYAVTAQDSATTECGRGCQPNPNGGRFVRPAYRCA